MANPFENQNMSFKRHDGREAKLHIISETCINEGSFGKIFDTIAEIDGHQWRFIIKKYKLDFMAPAEEYTKRAFKNYSLAKSAGLKVFDTFRMGGDKKSILMTNGFLGDNICIGSNNKKSVEFFGRKKIENIENIDKFLSEFFTEGLKATKNGITIPSDVPFFFVSKDEPTKIDFVFGDLDILTKVEPTKHNGIMNMIALENSLFQFCKKNVDTDYQENFMRRVRHYYEQGVQNIKADSSLE